MSFKRKITLFCLLFLMVLCVPSILIGLTFGLSPQYDQSFYGGMGIKYERLKNIKDRKIVVIGGSSVAFGLRSDIMEYELGIPVVNFGLYANLGTKYMLDVADNYINEGDIVIISPEQSKQALSLYYNAEAVWYSLDGNYQLLSEISVENYGDMAKDFLTFSSGKFKCWQSGEKPSPDGVYNVRSFNAYGDIEYNREYNILKNGFDSNMPISFDKTVIDTKFLEYINKYAADLREKGALVYYSLSPMNIAALDEKSSPDVISEYYNYMNEMLEFKMIGNPNTHLLDSDWFYDSNFHLNSNGAIYYTTILTQELKAELDDFTPIITKTPPKPEVPESDNSSSGSVYDDLNAAAEIFHLNGATMSTQDGKVVLTGEWTISGLTEYGRTLKRVTIPDTLAGLPVTNIGVGCFMDGSVEEIVFGEFISSIGSDAFKGCTQLRGIYISSKNPSTFSPSPDILTELPNCMFYIPQAAYSDYLFDYFWSYLSDRMLSY